VERRTWPGRRVRAGGAQADFAIFQRRMMPISNLIRESQAADAHA
jgi:hypothetical protein